MSPGNHLNTDTIDSFAQTKNITGSYNLFKLTQDYADPRTGAAVHQILNYSETTKVGEGYSVTHSGSVTTDMVAPPPPNGNPSTEHSVSTFTDNVTTGQENATITAQGNDVGTPDNSGNLYFLLTAASVNESASETTLLRRHLHRHKAHRQRRRQFLQRQRQRQFDQQRQRLLHAFGGRP